MSDSAAGQKAKRVSPRILRRPQYIEGSIKSFPAPLYDLLHREFHKQGCAQIVWSMGIWPRNQTLFEFHDMRPSTWELPHLDDSPSVTAVGLTIGRFRCMYQRQLIVVQHPLLCSGQPALIKFANNADWRQGGRGTSYWTVLSPSGQEQTQKIVRKIELPPEGSVPEVTMNDADDKVKNSASVSPESETTVSSRASTAFESAVAEANRKPQTHPAAQSKNSPVQLPLPNTTSEQQGSSNDVKSLTNGVFESPSVPKVPSLISETKSVPVQPTVEFVFKKTESGPVLRQRLYAQCRSVQMLYSQAAAAGIAPSDTTILHAQVAEQSKRTVVKDDHDDFEGVKVAINEEVKKFAKEGTGKKVIEVVVTPWTWDF